MTEDANGNQHQLTVNDAGSNKGDHKSPPSLTLAQIAQRRLGPTDPKQAVSALLPDTVWEDVRVVSPERLVEDENVPLGMALLRLREGVLHLAASSHAMKRRYIFAAYKLASRYKGNESAARDFFDFVSMKTTLRVPKDSHHTLRSILEIMFNFQFVTTKYATQNTVTRWFNGLVHYFEHDIDLKRVSHLINLFGLEKLYEHSVERRAFEAQRYLADRVTQPTFKEIDESPASQDVHHADADVFTANKSYEKPAEQQTEFDLPSADLDQQLKELHEDNEITSEEFFDVDEALNMVREGIILSMQLGLQACATKDEVESKDLALKAMRLSNHLVELGTLIRKG